MSGQILVSPGINAHNTFDSPPEVAPAKFSGATITKGGLQIVLPAGSVVVLELED